MSKTVIKELHQHQTKKTHRGGFFSPLLQHYVSTIKTVLCTVFSVLSTFYSPPQPCTIQHVSPRFKLQLHFIELKKGVLSLQSSGHTMRVVIKWSKQAQRQAQTLANRTQLQNTRHQKHKTAHWALCPSQRSLCLP